MARHRRQDVGNLPHPHHVIQVLQKLRVEPLRRQVPAGGVRILLQSPVLGAGNQIVAEGIRIIVAVASRRQIYTALFPAAKFEHLRIVPLRPFVAFIGPRTLRHPAAGLFQLLFLLIQPVTPADVRLLGLDLVGYLIDLGHRLVELPLLIFGRVPVFLFGLVQY